MKKLTNELAQEHLRDGADNLKECVVTIRRVLKSYPQLGETLDQAVNSISQAQSNLEKAGASLRRQG
jgi:hypothetical protein